MTMTLPLTGLFAFISAGVACFVALLLMRRGNRSAWPLAAFVGLFAYASGLDALLGLDPRPLPIPLARWLFWPYYLAAPCLYAYGLGTRMGGGRLWPHALPACAMAVILASPAARTAMSLHPYLIAGQVCIYAFFSLRLVRLYRGTLVHQVSRLEGLDISWFSQLCYGLVALLLFDLLVAPFISTAFGGFARDALPFMANLYLLWLAYGAVGQHFIVPLSTPAPGTPAGGEKYARSGLSPAAAGEIAAALRSTMGEDKLYQKPDLTLAELAGAVGFGTHLVSEVLNGAIGQNFYEFVNGYRLMDAERLLKETDQSVLEIAFASGFNNKTSFNRTFRERLGTTPSQYRRARDEAA